MILPYDPILSVLVVAGVFIYYACKGSGGSSKKEEKSVKDIFMDINEQNRYEKWLWEHRKD